MPQKFAICKTDEILTLFAALLRIAQIEGGARRAAFATLPLAPVLEHMRELFEAVAEGAGHHMRLTVAEAPAIRGDRALIIQLLSNLIENAILHTPPGTTITLALSQDKDRAMVTASERVTLYGLTIVPKRSVHYGPINPVESRDIFRKNT